MNIEIAKSFLKELRELCIKHNAFISGCGCCESPYAKNKEGEYPYQNIKVEYEINEVIAYADININDKWVTLRLDDNGYSINTRWL